MIIMYHGFTISLILVASLVLSTDAKHCQVIKTRRLKKVTTARRCKRRLLKMENGVGFSFTSNKKRCHVHLTDRNGGSKICVADKEGDPNSSMDCVVGETYKFKSESANKCEKICEGAMMYRFEVKGTDCYCSNPPKEAPKMWRNSKHKECVVPSQFRGPPECPCFTTEDVQSTVSSINDGQMDGSCTHGDKRISLNFNHMPNGRGLGYTVTSGNENPSCLWGGDVVKLISAEEASTCFDIVQNACEDLDDLLPDTCPCFSENELAHVTIPAEDHEVVCTVFDDRAVLKVIDHSAPNDDGTPKFDVQFGQVDNTCLEGDLITLITSGDAQHCRSLIVNECNNLPNDKPTLSCPCFNEETLGDAIDTSDEQEVVCYVTDDLTILRVIDNSTGNDGYPIFPVTFGTGNEGCYEGDMHAALTSAEANHCQDLITNAITEASIVCD